MDAESDRQIAEHVVRMHRYRNPGEQDGDRKWSTKYIFFFAEW